MKRQDSTIPRSKEVARQDLLPYGIDNPYVTYSFQVFSMRTGILVALLSLAACAPSKEQIAQNTFSAEQVATPVELFTAGCLDTLPELTRIPDVAKARGLEFNGDVDAFDAYAAPGDKQLILVGGEMEDKTMCGVTFFGPEEAAPSSAAFLEAAKMRTGGEPRKKYPSSYFHYAYHLANGSVMSYETKVRYAQGYARHIVLITPPVEASEVAEYIYN